MSFVRVRLPNGFEATLGADYVAGCEGLTVLDEPATNLRGEPLPLTRNGRRAKPRTTVDEAAALKSEAARHWLLQRAAVAFGTTTPTGGDAEGGTPA